MAGALRAELLKLSHRPALWILMAVLGVLVLLFGYVVLWAFSGTDELQGVTQGQVLATLEPRQIGAQALSMVTTFGAPLALILGALSMGSEYGWHTVKTIAVQRPTRVTLMAGRLVVLFAACLALAVTAFVSAAAGSAIVAVAEQLDAALPPWSEMAAAFGAAVLVLVVWCALGVALATLLRSAGMAIGLGLVYALVVDQLASGLLPLLGRVGEGVREALISTSSTALSQAISPSATEALGGAPTVDIGALQAVAVLTAYLVIAVVVAILVFQRRDIT